MVLYIYKQKMINTNITAKKRKFTVKFTDLTDEQQKFAKTRNTHLLTLASAGAGKTQSIIFFINDKMQEGIKPEEIISFSFTRKAASELKERVNAFFKYKNYNFKYISTIHSFCWNELIKPFYKDIGYTTIPTIVHEFSEDFMNSEYKEFGGKKERPAFNKSFISKISKDLQGEEFSDAETLRMFAYLVKNNLVMFDFMIHLANFILEDTDCIDRVKNMFKNIKYIITDEAQDLNPAQFRFLVKLRDTTGA